MTRKIKYLFGFLILIQFSALSQIAKVHLKDYHLKAKVKTINEVVFTTFAEDSVRVYPKIKTNVYYKRFNIRGLLMEMTNTMYSKKYQLRGICRYDTQGRISEFKLKSIRFKKNRLKPSKRAKNIEQIRDLYNYNNFKPVVAIRKIKHDSIYSKKVISYNERTMPVEIYAFEGDKDKKTRLTNVYNDKFQLISSESFNFFTKETILKLYRYDHEGHQIQEIVKTPGGQELITLKEYNENDDVVKYIAMNDGVKYTNKIQYVYDDKGNYIEKIELTNDNQKIITKREITYY